LNGERTPGLPQPPPGPHRPARDGLVVVFVAVVLLVLFQGSSLRKAGDEMQPGWERDVIVAAGKPTGWIADRFPFNGWSNSALAFLGSGDVGGAGSFDSTPTATPRGVPAVTPDSFDPAELGAKPKPPRPLKTLLVTGDSMAMPLDTQTARKMADSDPDVDVQRDPHVGTGISKSGLVDWGRLSTEHVDKRHPDAVVVFIGANEGFPLPVPGGDKVDCCGPDWAAAYANRVRRMMNTYRQGGRARVYWLTLPIPRDGDLADVARAVNAAIEVAAEPFRAQVRVLDMTSLFTPGGKYRDAMTVGGRRQIVRDPDGIHLNDTGAGLAADRVLAAIRADFGG
jgi:lysophospholipase L1-like esterase